jgi:hypothetical protein
VTHPTDDLEDRLSTALRSEADRVQPAAGSLDTIRARGRAARRRRRAVVAGAGLVAVAALAVAVPTLDRPDETVTTSPERRSTTTEGPNVMTGPAPANGNVDDGLWPDPTGELFTDPVDATRSFVETVIGVADPSLSELRLGEPGAGEVDVLGRGEGGRPLDRAASTVVLRQLDGVHWFVTAAGSDDVLIDTPEPLATVPSPATVTGQGRGYEGTIVVELRTRTAAAGIIGEAPTIAGAGEALAPFTVDVPFDYSPTPVAVLIARTDPGADGAVPGFAAQLARLGDDPSPSPTGAVDTTTTAPPYEFRSQPLWPFRTQAQADEWLAASAEGHQPWHGSAAMTALAFTNGYLGFTEIDLVTSDDVRAREAWIGVGYESEPGHVSTSAVIHLVRFGPSADAPWEVVGTRDSVFTLDTPAYGSTVSSTIRVGGTISGVDESVRVQVRQQSSPEPLGESCCVPAGGESFPWTATVSIAGATDPALTIVASSGGHVQDVETFAITGVRP